MLYLVDKMEDQTMTNLTKRQKQILSVAKEVLKFKDSLFENTIDGEGIQSFTIYRCCYFKAILAPVNVHKLKQIGFRPTKVKNSLLNPYYKFLTGRVE